MTSPCGCVFMVPSVSEWTGDVVCPIFFFRVGASSRGRSSCSVQEGLQSALHGCKHKSAPGNWGCWFQVSLEPWNEDSLAQPAEWHVKGYVRWGSKLCAELCWTNSSRVFAIRRRSCNSWACALFWRSIAY